MIINNIEQDKNQSWFKESQLNLFYSKIYYCKIERYESVDAELKEALKDVEWGRGTNDESLRKTRQKLVKSCKPSGPKPTAISPEVTAANMI